MMIQLPILRIFKYHYCLTVVFKMSFFFFRRIFPLNKANISIRKYWYLKIWRVGSSMMIIFLIMTKEIVMPYIRYDTRHLMIFSTIDLIPVLRYLPPSVRNCLKKKKMLIFMFKISLLNLLWLGYKSKILKFSEPKLRNNGKNTLFKLTFNRLAARI